MLFVGVLVYLLSPQIGYAQTTPSEVIQIIKNKQNYPNYVLIAAHRGYWADYPENSQGAYEMAIELGVDIVEMDVRLTKDGQRWLYFMMHVWIV